MVVLPASTIRTRRPMKLRLYERQLPSPLALSISTVIGSYTRFLLGARVRPGRRGGSPGRTPRLARPYHPECQRRLSVGERYVKARRAGSSYPVGREFLKTP